MKNKKQIKIKDVSSKIKAGRENILIENAKKRANFLMLQKEPIFKKLPEIHKTVEDDIEKCNFVDLILTQYIDVMLEQLEELYIYDGKTVRGVNQSSVQDVLGATLFKILLYDTRNREEVKAEYTIDGQRIDYILKNDYSTILWELKYFDCDILSNDILEQTSKYFKIYSNEYKVNYLVVMSGTKILVFTGLDTPNMVKEPLFAIDFLDLKYKDIEKLWVLRRDKDSERYIKSMDDYIIFRNKYSEYINAEEAKCRYDRYDKVGINNINVTLLKEVDDYKILINDDLIKFFKGLKNNKIELQKIFINRYNITKEVSEIKKDGRAEITPVLQGILGKVLEDVATNREIIEFLHTEESKTFKVSNFYLTPSKQEAYEFVNNCSAKDNVRKVGSKQRSSSPIPIKTATKTIYLVHKGSINNVLEKLVEFLIKFEIPVAFKIKSIEGKNNKVNLEF